MSQEVFETIYRGRQSALHHMAYMRMAKVLLLLRLVRESGIQLEGARIFDYGFGAGTFFRYCPKSAHLFGVEMDEQNVHDVSSSLRSRGFKNVDLSTISIDSWKDHPALQEQYDVFVCSHVLEHLPDPVDFLRTIRPCIGSTGKFLALVPINEISRNPFHVRDVSQELAFEWAAEAGFSVEMYLESDEIFYYLQPLYSFERGLGHRLAQAVSFAIGAAATACGPQAWWGLSKVLSTPLQMKPTQAAFVLKLPTHQPQNAGL